MHAPALTQVQSVGLLHSRAEASMPEFDPPDTYDLSRYFLPPHDDDELPGVAYTCAALVECRISALRTYCSAKYVLDAAINEAQSTIMVAEHMRSIRTPNLSDSGASIELDAHGYEINRRVHHSDIAARARASPRAPTVAPEQISLREGMRVLQQYGCPQDETYTAYYDINGLAVRSDAADFRIMDYASVSTVQCAQRAIVLHGPLAMIFPVYHYGPSPWVPTGTPMLGYHAMTAIGYDQRGFILRNSWGASWGKDGYCHFPYAEWGLQSECWTQLVSDARVPATPTTSRTSSGSSSSSILRKIARQLSATRNGSPRSTTSSPRSVGSPRTPTGTPRSGPTSPRAASDAALDEAARRRNSQEGEVRVLYASAGPY